MESFPLLIICMALGVVLRLSGAIDDRGPTVVNAVVIHMSLPALALLYTHDLPVGLGLLLPAAMAWIVFGAGYLLFYHLAKGMKGMDRQTRACLVLTAGLGNTSFVGLPMIEGFFGPEYMGIGMVCDTAGTFLALAIPGIILAASVSGENISGGNVAKQVFFFPPLVAIVLGFMLQPVSFPSWLVGILERVGATLSPLALLSVGLTLRFGAVHKHIRELAMGLGYKLILAPLGIIALYGFVVGVTDTAAKVVMFEAAMGPMITGGIIAMTYGVRPSLAAAMLSVGIPLSFLTLPAWYWLLQAL